MHAALYGELAGYTASDGQGRRTQDAYSLFYARSAAMGWLTPAVAGAEGGLWGMNEGEATPGTGSPVSGVAFFQVSLTGPTRDAVLPVQPFLACVSDVVARLGQLRLDAVQVLLPQREAGAPGTLAAPSGKRIAGALLDSRNWFADRDPKLRAQLRVTLDGGPDPSVREAASAIMQYVMEVSQNVFVFDSFSLAADDHLVLWPAPLDRPTTEFMHHRVTFKGRLVEWSLDALGWLAAFIADVASRNGITAPLMLTADHP